MFDVSLDKLIRGDEAESISEKLIHDGSETKRARYNMVSALVGAGLVFLGMLLIVIKGLSVEYIDAQGILHENFFLLPIGFLFIFCGLIILLSIGIRSILKMILKKEPEK